MTPNIFDFVGYYGPIILMVITIIIMNMRTKILLLYMAFFIINSVTNGVVKLLIREPRPTGQVFMDSLEKDMDSDTYGMPSGHAQSVAYTTTFLYLFTRSTSILMGASFIGVTTLYQRYKFRRHTISQLLTGTAVGALVAWVSNKIYIHNV
jgi:membrane-associated phospholipid phosphatase